MPKRLAWLDRLTTEFGRRHRGTCWPTARRLFVESVPPTRLPGRFTRSNGERLGVSSPRSRRGWSDWLGTGAEPTWARLGLRNPRLDFRSDQGQKRLQRRGGEKGRAEPRAGARSSETRSDDLWVARPPAPLGPVLPHDTASPANRPEDKRRRIAEDLAARRIDAAVLTQPESIAWPPQPARPRRCPEHAACRSAMRLVHVRPRGRGFFRRSGEADPRRAPASGPNARVTVAPPAEGWKRGARPVGR